jgi:hypothetical protein
MSGTKTTQNQWVSKQGEDYLQLLGPDGALLSGIDSTGAGYGALAGDGGGVTSVAATVTGGIISVSGSPVTSTGTLAFTVAGTSGGIPYFSSSSAWASSTALAAGQFVLGGGAGSAPTASFSIVPVASGGTGTASPALVAGTNITISGSFPNQTINSSGGGFTPGTQNITPVNYATDTGSATAYAVAPSPAATSYVAGLTVTFVALHTNTGSATLNVSSLGAKNITKLGVNSLNPGDILVNGLYFATYDGTEFQLLNPTVGATPAVVGRSVSGTTDTITPIVGTDLGTEITYTSSSAVAVSVAAPTFAGAFFTVNIAGLGVVTLTPVSGNIGLGGVSGGASIALTGPLSCYINSPDGINYNANCHPNVKNAQTVTLTIASGSQALGTGAISSGACASPISVGATGVLTTDTILANFNGDPTAVTGYIPSTSGMLTIIAYPSAGTVNFKVCNNTASSITPGAITLNYRVVR